MEYEDGKILAFYPNCNEDNKGHSAVGWMEYKRSEDYGETWSEPIVLDYSKNLFDEGQEGGPNTEKFSAFGEKAVLTDNGDIVLFFLVCNITHDAIWRRFQIPTYIISEDGGTHGVSRMNCATTGEGSTMRGITTERYSRFTSRITMRSTSWATRTNLCISCT